MIDWLSDPLALAKEEKDLGWLATMLRALIVFSSALVMVRIAHKRFFAKKNAFDVILALILASMLARPINGPEALFPSIAAGFVLVILHRVLSSLAFKSSGVDDAIKGHSNLLIKDGILQEETLKIHTVTQADLEEQLRLKGVERIEEVKLAILERSGEISVIR